ncbi:MAG: type 2 isopentenyl-diphosphate Delta-isomerase [Theionarchaea archaeon]|nr:type 2 isopentenyl-diphosphate Delta-isomerase [Theionarchaea archaeon]
MGKTVSRKADHVRICLEEDVEVGETGLDCIRLVHIPLPEVDCSEISTSCEAMGRSLKAPILINAMTGGYDGANEINMSLARAAQNHGIGLGLGSMRAMIENRDMTRTYDVRDIAPDILLLGNIGIPQLLDDSFEPVFDAMERIGVDGIAVHMNALQEATMPEGETDFAGGLQALSEFSKQSKWPVVAKETGAGVPRETAIRIEEAGIEWLDIGGFGGTSFSAVESHRAKTPSDRGLATSFCQWGIPTAASLFEARSSTNLRIIASGGIRSGLDVAKCMSMGADLVGSASPFLKALTRGEEELSALIELMKTELVTAMFLTGSGTLPEFRQSRIVISSWLRSWLKDRGLDVSRFAK